jgi:hypothetical protein
LGRGLDEKAIEAVKTWRFEPGKRYGKPVATLVKVEVTFQTASSPEPNASAPKPKTNAPEDESALIV